MFSRYAFETFKHVRLKPPNELSKNTETFSGESFKFRCKILCEILKCNIYTAREIILKNKKIVNLSHNNFCVNAKFIEKYLKLSDLVEYPCLLSLQPNLLQHRYFSLKELGLINVTPSCILRFPHILKETPETLKQRGFHIQFKYKADILNEYLNTSKRTEVNNRLQHMYEDGSNLQKIREIMNAEFLSAKLDCSIGKSHQMLYKHAALRVQSIVNTDQLLNILLYKFGFSVSKIQSSLNLLSVYHEAAEQFLIEFPEIYDVDTLFLVRRVPLLLKQESDYIHKIETVLKEYDIKEDQLVCCPKVLLINPNTLQKRLFALHCVEDFAVLKSNKKFLWLVYYYNNLKSRLMSLKAENMPCSINMFTASKSTFEKHLLYNNTRTYIRETCVYLAEIFKMSEKEIFNRLKHCSNIRSGDQNFSTLNCQKVMEYLLLCGVTKEQIFNGLEIVFYDIDTVKENFKCLKTHPECQPYHEWISHFNLIQLLIYAIEFIKKDSDEIETNEEDDLILEFSN